MRTTLSIDDDILLATKSIAEREQKTVGAVLSDLARQALRRKVSASGLRNGVPLLPSKGRAVPVTMDLVNQLRDELA